MKPIHTPGPWETTPDATPDWHTQVTVYAEATGQRIATVFEAETNANLIAAAPDLLAALEELSRLTHQNNEIQRAGMKVSPEAWGEIYNATSTARAAIARAKGEA